MKKYNLKLKNFLIETKKAGYGASDSKSWIKEKDGSTTIVFKSGDFRMHDNFFGGDPWGGREIVFFRDKPVWIMVMYGKVEDSVEDYKEVYEFLKKALRNQPNDLPLRGPRLLHQKQFTYKNNVEGDLENFSGEETIYLNGKKVYSAIYTGGFVDQRKD
ncbi:MAG: DUF5680 domain-containing protein [Thermoplasmata archaeon]